MSGLDRRLREAADLAERAAVIQQHAELAGARACPEAVGGLQFVADNLHHAAAALAPAPFAPRRPMVEISLKSGVCFVTCIAALVAAPDPAAPWALASALAGGEVLARLTGFVVAAVWDWRSVTSLASSGGPADIDETIAELRTRIRAITAALEADRFDEHLDVGRRIEPALMWLDAVELGAPELCQGE